MVESCQVHLAHTGQHWTTLDDTGRQVNRNKHLVKTLLQLECTYFDRLAMTVKKRKKKFVQMICSISTVHRQDHHAWFRVESVGVDIL